MPKIIENLQDRLLAEARRQVEENGYAAMTIRSVAKSCGVGVGTVYNYFSSKDTMVATFMLEEWQKCIGMIHAVAEAAEMPEEIVRCIYDELRRYERINQKIFEDKDAASVFGASSSRYHVVLRSQLAEPLKRFCSSDFIAEFIAEALLNWSMAGKEFAELYGVIRKLL